MKREFTVFNRQYFIDETGKVTNKYGRIIRHRFRQANGYPYVEFRHTLENGVLLRKKIMLHRILAESFIPNPFGFEQVNHIDGDKTNFDLSNLEWVTGSENQMHSRYVLCNKTGFDDVAVKCVETGTCYKSTRDAWRATGISYTHISECASGKRKSAGGYHWEKGA